MNVQEAKQVVAKYREKLKSKGSGAVVGFSEHGPANIAIVEAAISAMEDIDARLSAVEKRLSEIKVGTPH